MKRRLLISALLSGCALGCARTTTQLGYVSEEQLHAEEARQKAFVVSTAVEQEQRLLDIGFPLLRDARSLCTEETAPQFGLTISSAREYSRNWQDAARNAGISDSVTVIAVARESPAARAGLRLTDRIVGVDNTPVDIGRDGIEKVSELLRRALERTGSRARLSVIRAGVHLEIPLIADSTCAFPLVVVRDDEIQASVDGNTIYVTTGMLRFASDDELATVVSHEIAHNAMRHVQAKQRNSLLAGLLGAAIDVAAATQGVDTSGEYTKQFLALGAMTFSQDFEREADYVGMYILALNGRSLDKASELWRRMAVESPGSITFARSHPTTAERYIRLDQAAAEISAKRARGYPLIPEFKEGHRLDKKAAQVAPNPKAVETEEVPRSPEQAFHTDEDVESPAVSSRGATEIQARHRPTKATSSWTGRTSMTTELFSITSTRWGILYSVKPIPGFKPYLRLEAYRYADGHQAEPVFSHTGTRDGTVEIAKGPGIYYIKIFSSNADWRVSVQQ